MPLAGGTPFPTFRQAMPKRTFNLGEETFRAEPFSGSQIRMSRSGPGRASPYQTILEAPLCPRLLRIR